MLEVQKRNHFDSLLGQLQEEAGELITEISKAKRFGLYEKFTEDSPTNIERVINEVKDIASILSMIEDNYGVNFGVELKDKKYLDMKKSKVVFHEDISEKLGLLDKDGVVKNNL